MDTVARAPKNWAVVLIHGVGDTTPGMMSKDLSKVLAEVYSHPRTVVGHQQLPSDGVTRLAESEDKLAFDPEQTSYFPEKTIFGRGQSQFPVVQREGQAGPDRVLLAEVHWADLTRISVNSRILAQLPLFVAVPLRWLAEHLVFTGTVVRTVYGIRHVALQAALIPGRVGWWFHAALRSAIFLLQGPAYALYVFESLLCVLYLVAIPDRWDDAALPRWPSHVALVLVTGTLAVLSGLRWAAWRRCHLRAVFWPSLLIVTAVALVHLLLRATGAAEVWYNFLIPNLNIEEGQNIGEVPLVVFIIDYVLDKLFASIAVCVLGAGTLLVVAAFRADRPTFRTMWAAFLATALLVALWLFLAEPVDLVAQWLYDRSRCDDNPTYTLWFNEATLAGLVLVLAVAGVFVIVRQTRWARRGAAGQAPRLIVGLPIQICLVAVACLLFPMIFIDGSGIRPLRFGTLQYHWIYLIYAVALTFVLFGAVLFRNVLHILRDVIIHFESPSSNGLFLGPPYSARRYPVRRRIALRFRTVLEMLLSKQRPTHLLVIAHSQGTVIALEELRKPRWGPWLAQLECMTILTFGSPLTNLYQNYLPLLYGDLTAGRWRRLMENAHTWVNLYRPDDYVGTHIASPIAHWPLNVQLKPGLRLRGHTRYWEYEVFLRIRDLLP
jgi:hypothetical protein